MLFRSVSDPNFNFTVPVATVPKHQGAVFLSYELLKGTLNGLRIGGSVVSVGNYTFVRSLRNVNRFGQLYSGAHTLVGLNVSYLAETGWAQGLEISLSANNIFDKKVFVSKEDHPGFAITRENPRTYVLGLRYKIK